MTKLRLYAALVLGGLLCVVIFQNLDSVSTRFLFWTLSLPRAVLLFLSVLAGFVLGLLTALGASARKSKPG